ncbi:MAG: hypothetical protein JZU55_08070, partial [Afipia sp.]|nr:hypothetical protein [Afipia sp.]
MDRRINPFNELYVSETIRSTDFVRIFSPLVVDSAAPLFLPGNVVLQGVQGSGKSMLLSLLRPEVRTAYLHADVDFPLKGKSAATRIARADCWFGFVAEMRTWDGLKGKIAERIGSYWSFFNFNSDSIPGAIADSKTSIGEPISLVAEVLRQLGIIGEDVHVFVQIDQYEELLRLEGRYKELGVHYRSVINKALGLRDPRVSYRIGTRRYGWNDSQLERDRDYKLI